MTIVQIQKGTFEKVPFARSTRLYVLLFFRNRYSRMIALIFLVDEENARPIRNGRVLATSFNSFGIENESVRKGLVRKQAICMRLALVARATNGRAGRFREAARVRFVFGRVVHVLVRSERVVGSGERRSL